MSLAATLRREMKDGNETLAATLRREMKEGNDALKAAIEQGDEETRHYMRVLYENLLEYIATIGEGRKNPRRPKGKS